MLKLALCVVPVRARVVELCLVVVRAIVIALVLALVRVRGRVSVLALVSGPDPGRVIVRARARDRMVGREFDRARVCVNAIVRVMVVAVGIAIAIVIARITMIVKKMIMSTSSSSSSIPHMYLWVSCFSLDTSS